MLGYAIELPLDILNQRVIPAPIFGMSFFYPVHKLAKKIQQMSTWKDKLNFQDMFRESRNRLLQFVIHSSSKQEVENRLTYHMFVPFPFIGIPTFDDPCL